MSDYEIKEIDLQDVDGGRPTEPKVHLRPTGRLYFNQPAAELWFQGVETVSFAEVTRVGETSFDPEKQFIGIIFNGEKSARKVRREDYGAVVIRANRIFEEIGWDYERIPKTIKLDPVRLQEEDMLLVPLTDAEEYIWPCEHCDQVFQTEHGRDVHRGREHGEEKAEA